MHGGPATIHGARAYDAFCEFADALDAGESRPYPAREDAMCHPVRCRTCGNDHLGRLWRPHRMPQLAVER